jgi:hypothetical protein
MIARREYNAVHRLVFVAAAKRLAPFFARLNKIALPSGLRPILDRGPRQWVAHRRLRHSP